MSEQNIIGPLDVEEIKRILPHRYPMLLIDVITELKINEYSKAIKNISINEPYFEGHFPEKAIMPGVLMVEAMAQTAGVLVRKSAFGDTRLVYFMSIENAKFRKPVVPGDTIEICASKIRSMSNVWKFTGVATVKGVIVAEAVFSIAIVG